VAYHENAISIVKNGKYKGMKLDKLIKEKVNILYGEIVS
jgi:mannose-6-phosphate isomerase class I